MELRTSAALAVWLAAASPCLADKIITVEGGTLRGQILEEGRRVVKLRDSRGLVIDVPRREIEQIVHEDEAAELKERRAKVAAGDVEGLVDLARWAKRSGLGEEAKGILREVLAAEPEHPVARKGLGYKKVDGRWVRGKELRALQAKQRASERAEAKASTAAGATAGAQPVAGVLPEEDQALLAIVRGSSPLPRRVEALRALSEKGGPSRDALRVELERMLDKARKKLRGHFTGDKGKVRAKLAARIGERRKAALSIIFDLGKYPDANHGAAGQPLVDAAVGELMRAYDDPLAELASDDAVARLQEKVTRLAGWLGQFAGAPTDAAAVLAEDRQEIAQAIGMRRIPIDPRDGKLLRKSQQVLEANERAKTSLTSEERACVRATNEYRMMFGLPALTVFEPLVRAARGHSEEMLRLGFFDHTSPTPANRTPAMRCQREGASFTGENIAMGMHAGRGAFNAWYRSSGHHRNMLGKVHRSIGVGQAGKYWTQNFGGGAPSRP